MYTKLGLLEMHKRCHRGFEKLIAHCADFSHEELTRSHDGFGYPSMQMQLCHIIGAEAYWLGVLEGRMDADDRAEDDLDANAIGVFRGEVFGRTQEHIKSADEGALNVAQDFVTWGEKIKTLIPAHVFLRTQTHLFQHQGQITAMCRLLGKPIHDIDYSHEP